MEVSDDDERPYTVRERRAFHRRVAASIVVLYLGTIAGFWQVDQLRAHDRQQARVAARLDERSRRERRSDLDAQLDREARVARDAFVTTCDRQNRNLRSVRTAIVGSARDQADVIVRSSPPERQALALSFGAQLIDRAKRRAIASAPPVDCTYPPRPVGGG